MSERTRYVGLDVHAATIAVAVAEDRVVDDRGTIVNEPAAINRPLPNPPVGTDSERGKPY